MPLCGPGRHCACPSVVLEGTELAFIATSAWLAPAKGGGNADWCSHALLATKQAQCLPAPHWCKPSAFQGHTKASSHWKAFELPQCCSGRHLASISVVLEGTGLSRVWPWRAPGMPECGSGKHRACASVEMEGIGLAKQPGSTSFLETTRSLKCRFFLLNKNPQQL